MAKMILNGKLYNAKLRDREFQCKIGWVNDDTYYVYENFGEGVAVYTLNSNQVLELYLTGSVEVGYLQIKDR